MDALKLEKKSVNRLAGMIAKVVYMTCYNIPGVLKTAEEVHLIDTPPRVNKLTKSDINLDNVPS